MGDGSHSAGLLDEPAMGRKVGKPLTQRLSDWLSDFWENSSLALVFSVFVVMRAMDRVFSKRVSDRMANYTLMYYNVLWPIGVQVMQVLMCAGWVWYQRVKVKDKRYGWSFFHPTATIATTAGAAYPQWRLALFSFWDQLNAALTGIPSPYITQAPSLVALTRHSPLACSPHTPQPSRP